MPKNLIIGNGKQFSKPDRITPILAPNQNQESIHEQEIDLHFEAIADLQKVIKKNPTSIKVPVWKQQIKQLKRTIENQNREFKKWNDPRSISGRGNSNSRIMDDDTVLPHQEQHYNEIRETRDSIIQVQAQINRKLNSTPRRRQTSVRFRAEITRLKTQKREMEIRLELLQSLN